MPIAAVPEYLGKDFKDASPGLRFGMYLKLWGINHSTKELLWKTHDITEDQKKKETKVDAMHDATKLTCRDKEVLSALLERQQTAFVTSSAENSRVRLIGTSVAPFTTGLGNAHPLENGFSFLNPYGLPYLPGSSIKGVLRQAARELASGEWGDAHGWTDKKNYPIMVGGKLINLSLLDVLFGSESKDGDTQHLRGALSFWDVIPKIKGDSLVVDVMTPHQGHYYQGKKDRKAGDSTTPHDSGQPIPISFLTIPEGSDFTFFVMCDLAHLQRFAPDLAHNDRWKKLLTAAFDHTFEWLGFGAKTAVGYGCLAKDEEAQKAADEAAHERAVALEKVARLASMTPNQQQIDAFVTELRDKHTQYPSYKENANSTFHNKARALANAAHKGADWTADEKKAAADAIEEWLPKLVKIDIKDERKRLKLADLHNS